jgi:predicted RND superfamily exporter protein
VSTPRHVDDHASFTRAEALAERYLFSNRKAVLVFFLIVSVILAFFAAKLRPDASFEKMIPTHHPYIVNYLKYEGDLRRFGNVIRVVVEAKNGDIYDREYLETLRKITDEAFYIPGVDRGNMRSLWTPNTLWREVTEAGMTNGRVIPDGFDGSKEKLDAVRLNVGRAGLAGSLVANDFKSSIVLLPLTERDPQTGAALNYAKFSEQLEQQLRDKYQSERIGIHIVGFAKIIGDLIEGASSIAIFFAITWILTALLLYAYCRCWKSTLMTMLCCTLAVLWQLGVVSLLGYGLDPYSILVPFLTFAIGVSHAVQNINTVATEMYEGRSALDAARKSFSVLFIPGTIALVCDAVGFATLLAIDIGVIRELAISASVGVAVIIFTKMFLLPVLMSYVGVSDGCLAYLRRKSTNPHAFARAVSRVTEPGIAGAVVAVSAVLLGLGFYLARDLKIGDLDPGAPELRANSRYNLDNAYLTKNYSTSTDVFVTMAVTKEQECGIYPVTVLIDRFQATLENVPGVESTRSIADEQKRLIGAVNEANPKWAALTRDRYMTNSAMGNAPKEYANIACNMDPVVLFLTDHKAETLTGVVQAAEAFAKEYDGPHVKFLLAGGNAGVDAATNIVIKQAERTVLLLVYGVVALLVLWEFRSWRVTLAIMAPLYVTSVLCEAIMAKMGLGVKVATLPVIALGVGIGVDYGIYVYNKLRDYLAAGQPLKEAYFNTLRTTGTAVAFTGLTLAVGVFTWAFSAIKFQADMGLLLTFLFIWNMIGAIVVLPAILAVLRKGRAQAGQPREVGRVTG